MPRPSAVGAGPRGHQGLVERDPELAVLRRSIVDVLAGGSGVVTITGEPGTGRTALLARAMAEARSQGLRVVRVRFAPGGGAAQRTGASLPAPRSGAHGSLGEPGPWNLGAAFGSLRVGPRDAEPALLAVDDAQWADPSALAWMDDVIRWRGRNPVLMVVAFRGICPPDRKVATPDLDHRLHLRTLTRDGVRRLMTRAYGTDVPEAFVRAVATATSGNPAVVQAILRRCPPPLPPAAPARFAATVAEITASQVDRVMDTVPVDLVRLLRVVAVCGQELAFPLVCELAGLPAGSVAEALGRALGTGLVTGTDRIQSVSAAVAERILAGMDRKEREDLYTRAADLGRRSAVCEDALAGWLTHSRCTGQPWVVGLLRDAARRAHDAGRRDLSVQLLSRALGEEMGAAGRAELLIALASAETYVAPGAANRHLTQVLAHMPGSELSSLRLRAADLLSCRGAGPARVIATAYRQGVGADGERDDLLGLHWLAQSGDGDTFAGPVRLVPPLPDPPVSAAQQAARAWQLAIHGREPDMALSLARSVARSPLLRPRLTAAQVLMIGDDYPAADQLVDQVLDDARRLGTLPAVTPAYVLRAEMLLRRGRLTDATDWLSETMRELPPQRWPLPILLKAVAVELMVYMEGEEFDAAEELAAEHLAPGGDGGFGWTYLLFARGVLELCLGRTQSAASLLHECGRRLSADGWQNPAVLPWRSIAAMADKACGRPGEADRLIAEELTLAERWGTASTLGAARLWSARKAAGGDARREMRTAVRLLRNGPRRLRYAEALIGLAAIAVEEGDRVEAAGCLSAADRLVSEHGWEHLRERVEELASECGAAPAPVTTSTLSEAQRRVADLAVAGLSNPEIAHELSVSRRTVELHLTNIYRTFGIGGRAELRGVLDRAGEGS
ncbi:MAG: LuxR C-terminal-related transcriptional regulator [Actinocatenispora sp.]